MPGDVMNQDKQSYKIQWRQAWPTWPTWPCFDNDPEPEAQPRAEPELENLDQARAVLEKIMSL